MAYDGKHFTAAARLWPKVARDPKLDLNGWNQYRWKSARAAALAAAGQGDDAARLDDATKAKFRQQALDGLSAELTDSTKQIESAPPQAGLAIVKALAEWRANDALAGIRDAAPLAKLPTDEQKDWRCFGPVPALITVVPTSFEGEQPWRCTTKQPAEGWKKADFDDRVWQEGSSGFGGNRAIDCLV